MRNAKIIVACALGLALSGLTGLHAAEEGRKEAKATVRSVHGKVEYLDNTVWAPVKPNMKFSAGVTIRTGADGVADISINGTASAVRITNNTTLQISAMSYVGTAREGDTTTMLNLVSGTVLGNVKKISANSRYEITTPHGVAGIRGTDFLIEAIPTSDGQFTVTFNSITGIITVSAVIGGNTVTRTLPSQTSWTIGETPRQLAAAIVAADQAAIISLVQSVAPDATIGTPTTIGKVIPTTSPFPAGQPQGQPASQ